MHLRSMDMLQIMERFHKEEECRQILAELRWPDGVTCPRCKGTEHGYNSNTYRYDCYGCGYGFTALVGTVFQDTKLPLRKWFMAVLLMVEAKKGISANQVKRTLGVSYKTAWFLCHRIRSAMAEANQLTGDVHTNTVEGVWSLSKRSVTGSYHKLSAKHLDAYLDELEWRFNNRKNPYLFRDTLLRLIESQNLHIRN